MHEERRRSFLSLLPRLWEGAWGAALTYTLVLFALVGAGVLRVPFLRGFLESDFIAAHGPEVLFFQRATHVWGTWPLWFPARFSGHPLYADPLGLLAYPPAWPFLYLPFPLGLNLLALVHLAFGGVGMYLWLRASGLSPLRAWLGGLFWLVWPRTWMFYGMGHVGFVLSRSWWPWLFWATARGRWLGWAWSAGMMALADPRGALLGGGLWAVYHGFRAWTRRHRFWPALRDGWLRMVATALLAGMVAAPLALPLWAYTRWTLRARVVQVEYALGLNTCGCGLSVPRPVLASPEVLFYLPLAFWVAALGVWLKGKARAWLVVFLLGLWLAFGKEGGLYALLGHVLPGFTQMRVPARYIDWVHWAVLVSALRVDIEDLRQPWVRRALVAWLGIWLPCRFLDLPLVMKETVGAVWLPSWYGLLSLGQFLGWAGLVGLSFDGVPRFSKGKGWVFAVVALTGLLSGVYARSLVEFRPFDVLHARERRLMQRLLAHGGWHDAAWPMRWQGPRVYASHFVLLGLEAVESGMALAHGYHPLYLAAYDAFLSRAVGIPRAEYSVTSPPLVQPTPPPEPDPAALALLRVRYWVSPVRVAARRWRPLGVWEGFWVYENPSGPCPLAWMEPPGREGAGCTSGKPAWAWWSPNEIRVRVTGPGRLVLSEVAYPAWKVYVDGQPAAAQVAYGVLRAVRVPEGAHWVVWRLEPGSWYLGWRLFLLAAAVSLLVTVAPVRWRSRQ